MNLRTNFRTLISQINVKGEVFGIVVTFAAGLMLRLGSVLILSRMLDPEAYGFVAAVMSIMILIELLSDPGLLALIIRDENGDKRTFLSTVWTFRLIRGIFNSALLFVSAPLLARMLGQPELTDPLRILSLNFLISGFESTSFLLAYRFHRARLIAYLELATSLASSVFVIVYVYIYRDYYGIIYGMIFQKIITVVISHFFYREYQPYFHIDRAALTEILRFARFVIPSSLITIALMQYDKLAFIRLFDLRLMGLYGIAGNMAGAVDSLTTKISRSIFQVRCATIFRSKAADYGIRCYSTNRNLLILLLLPAAAVAGMAEFIVELLLDPRYSDATLVLQILCVRQILNTFSAPAEDILVAGGRIHVVLVGNIIRICWLVPMSLLGYYFGGFKGFLLMSCLDLLPQLIYFWILHFQDKYKTLKLELLRVGIVAVVVIASYVLGKVLLYMFPEIRLH